MLGEALNDAAASRMPGASFPPLAAEHSALSLKEAESESDFLERFIQLIRIRHGLMTGPFLAPRKPGVFGRCMAGIKMVLWKLLRYQHDYMSSQQSALNELLAGALEQSRKRHQRDINALSARVEELERHGHPVATGNRRDVC